MGNHDGWTAVEIIPTLGVPNLEDAIAYYGGLGFHEEWRYPADGEPTHAGIGSGEVHLMLALCPGPERIQPQNVYVVMRNIRPFHAYVRRALGEDVPDLVDSYGMRDFGFKDPWGHLHTFGEAC